jgi:lysophospholipase L1-like esterase
MLRLLVSVLMFCLAGAVASAQDPVRVLLFGDSNTFGSRSTAEAVTGTRHPEAERWTRVVADALGPSIRVVADGRIGRYVEAEKVGTGWIPTIEGGELAAAFRKSGPFDTVVIMLGTNDVSGNVRRGAEDAARALVALARAAPALHARMHPSRTAPKLLLIAPPPLGDTSRTFLAGLFGPGEGPSRQFGSLLLSLAKEANVFAFDAGTVISAPGGADGVHFSTDDHQRLGAAIAPLIRSLAFR